MLRNFILLAIYFHCLILSGQEKALEKLLADPSMRYSSVTFCIVTTEDSILIAEYNSCKSLIPGSVIKLITAAAALEMLGPVHTFRTRIGYTGTLDNDSGLLSGDIIIKGGGDPALGSEYFAGHYGDFVAEWIDSIKVAGIKYIKGKIVTDDSYFSYQPLPEKWQWQDIGNYYGAGVYGLSVFDNTCKIHFKTSSSGSIPSITGFEPLYCNKKYKNWLVAEGNNDRGYVFSTPYTANGWLAGTIPSNRDDFILKAAMTDPPLLLAEIISDKLAEEGIRVSGTPATTRLEPWKKGLPLTFIAETVSPPLFRIIEILNHESINMYAEHLLREMGKKLRNNNSISSGKEAIADFIRFIGINSGGMFIEDGSGLSLSNAVNARDMVRLLIAMKKRGRYFREYYSSLPEGGKDGTLKNCFMDPVFNNNLRAKSGSMSRIRSYAGYFTTLSGKEMAFSITINNFTGSSQRIVAFIEDILKETILTK